MNNEAHYGGTIKEAADYYKVSTKTIRRWIAAGLIRAERVGPRYIRVQIGTMKVTPIGASE